MAQNPVPNGDFEFYTSCPFAVGRLGVADPWKVPTQGTSDYFNACAGSSCDPCIPVNHVGNLLKCRCEKT